MHAGVYVYVHTCMHAHAGVCLCVCVCHYNIIMKLTLMTFEITISSTQISLCEASFSKAFVILGTQKINFQPPQY